MDSNVNPPQNGSTENGQAGQTQADGNVAELQKRIQELEAQVKEKEQKYLYLYADFDNFKKRQIKERSDLLKFGWESLARDLLQVIDNLERALEHMPPTTDKTLSDGIQMVLNQFRATLSKQGVQLVDTSQKTFDPHLHEAVGQEPSPALPAGTVVREQLKGYTLHGRLLRPARVIISGDAKANSEQDHQGGPEQSNG